MNLDQITEDAKQLMQDVDRLTTEALDYDEDFASSFFGIDQLLMIATLVQNFC